MSLFSVQIQQYSLLSIARTLANIRYKIAWKYDDHGAQCLCRFALQEIGLNWIIALPSGLVLHDNFNSTEARRVPIINFIIYTAREIEF